MTAEGAGEVWLWFEGLQRELNRPFGQAELASGLALAPISAALSVGAENLLSKATRALHDGDLERATAMVLRAASLPFDEHEEVAPAAMAAHMQLFSLVVDTLEECTEADRRWLDLALDVLVSANEHGRCTMRDVLAEIDQDYRLPPAEQRRLRAVTRDVPAAPNIRDLPDLGPSELAERVLGILEACVRYEGSLALAAS